MGEAKSQILILVTNTMRIENKIIMITGFIVKLLVIIIKCLNLYLLEFFSK